MPDRNCREAIWTANAIMTLNPAICTYAGPTPTDGRHLYNRSAWTAHMTDQPYQKTNGFDDSFPAIRWARYASVPQNQHGVARIAPSLTFPTSTGRLVVSRVQNLAAALRQRKELRRKPCHPIWMGLPYLTEIAATNFLGAGIRRHLKNSPPLDRFGLPESFRGKLTLPMAPYLGHALLFGWPLTLRLLFCAGPALLHRPPRGAFRFLTSRAKDNPPCKKES